MLTVLIEFKWYKAAHLESKLLKYKKEKVCKWQASKMESCLCSFGAAFFFVFFYNAGAILQRTAV